MSLTPHQFSIPPRIFPATIISFPEVMLANKASGSAWVNTGQDSECKNFSGFSFVTRKVFLEMMPSSGFHSFQPGSHPCLLYSLILADPSFLPL